MKEYPRKQALRRALENYFGADARRIRHAKRTAEYAELILPGEGGADPYCGFPPNQTGEKTFNAGKW